MRKYSLYAFLLMLATLFLNMTCCEEFDYYDVYMYNNSNDTIYVYSDLTKVGADTLTSGEAFKYYPESFRVVLPRDTVDIQINLDDYCEGQILVYKKQTFKEYSIAEIMSNDLCDRKMIVKMSDFSESDFLKGRYVVEYKEK